MKQNQETDHPTFPSSLSTSSIRQRAQRNQASKSSQADQKYTPTISQAGRSGGTKDVDGLPLSTLLTPTKSAFGQQARNTIPLQGDTDRFSLRTPPVWQGTQNHRQLSASAGPAGPQAISSAGTQSAYPDEHSTGGRVLSAHEAYNTGLDPFSVSVYKARKSLIASDL